MKRYFLLFALAFSFLSANEAVEVADNASDDVALEVEEMESVAFDDSCNDNCNENCDDSSDEEENNDEEESNDEE